MARPRDYWAAGHRGRVTFVRRSGFLPVLSHQALIKTCRYLYITLDDELYRKTLRTRYIVRPRTMYDLGQVCLPLWSIAENRVDVLRRCFAAGLDVNDRLYGSHFNRRPFITTLLISAVRYICSCRASYNIRAHDRAHIE